MARKASDLVMLLGSRSVRGRRGKSSFVSRSVSSLGNGLIRLLGGSPRKSTRRSSGSAGSMVPGWFALGLALLCFGGGYMVRGYLVPSAWATDIKAEPRQPGVIDVDTKPLASQGFFVAAYLEMPAVEAKRRAIRLSRYLQLKGLAKARPYEYPSPKGPLWVVIVYCDGNTDREASKARLLDLPEGVPDPVFVGIRNSETDWPNVYPVQ